MSDNKHDDFVDKLLDAGLARYSAAEPRPGLEGRILAGLRAQPEPAGWLSWRWVSLAAAMVLLVAVVMLFVRREQPAAPPPTVAVKPSVPTPAPAPAVEPARSARREKVAPPRVEQARVERPRLATFPAPAPLSEQERLLLVFLQQTPKEQLVARQLGARPIERLQIPPGEIEDLSAPKEVNN